MYASCGLGPDVELLAPATHPVTMVSAEQPLWEKQLWSWFLFPFRDRDGGRRGVRHPIYLVLLERD